MSVYSIADLHLPGKDGNNKSMEIFGSRWTGCVDKLIKNWTAVVNDNDTIVIPGDISWAMTLEDAIDDFKLLESLPGQKIIGKGNHDFWWATASKMNKFFEKNNFKTLRILYNNSYVVEGCAICGSRGWFSDEANQKTVGDVDWLKIVDRETARLKLSLESVSADSLHLPKIVFLHFPPVWGNFLCQEILDTLTKYGVKNCYFGHIHGGYNLPSVLYYGDMRLVRISADHLSFLPYPIK